MNRVTTQQTTLRMAAEYVAAWNAHNPDRLAALFAEDGAYGEFGEGIVVLGRVEIRRHFAAVLAAVSDLTLVLTAHPVAEDDRVICDWMLSGTLAGRFAGVRPTGKPFELAGMTVLIVKDGKIDRAATSFDLRDRAQPQRNGKKWYETPQWAAFLNEEDNIGLGE